MILISVDELRYDMTAKRVSHLLEAAGADVMLVDSEALRTGRAHLSVQWQGGRPVSGGITLDGRFAPFADLRSAWFWRLWFTQPWPDTPEAKLEPDVRQFFLGQWRRFEQGLGQYLTQAGVFCANPFPQVIACEEKLWQLELARSLGLAVPDTLITADLAEARAFFDAHGGEIIYKTLTPPRIKKPGVDGERDRYATVFTNRVKRADLADEKRFLPSPGIFQQLVPKEFEVRVTVVGEHAFAAAIDAQASEKARLDWRRYDNENTFYAPHVLPPETEARVVALVRGLGLVYGAADLIVTPAGEYVFLELNPNGQYLWVEERTGLPISASIAAMLLAGRPTYERKEQQYGEPSRSR